MANPFKYGGIVSGADFCNRKIELEDITRAMHNSENLFLYSERRFGKTSLIKQALKKLPLNKFRWAYIDLWPTDSDVSFATAFAKAISESMSSSTEKLIEFAKKFFGHLSPSISIDEEGKPKITFGFSGDYQTGLDIEEILEVPPKISERRKCKIIIVFDEFQQILEYDSDYIERRLRSSIQNHKNVSYIFLGSRKHLIQKMFLNKTHPLYRIGGHYPLKPINEKNWLPFIQKKFLEYNKNISNELIFSICHLTEGHPFYTQHLCHSLWELCEENTSITSQDINLAVNILLNRENYAYTALWESIGKNQKRFLKGLALESKGVKTFSSEFFLKYGLRSASNVQRAAEALLERDIIDRENGYFVIIDRFFKIWIKKIQSV